jgi:hypothetical protein
LRGNHQSRANGTTARFRRYVPNRHNNWAGGTERPSFREKLSSEVGRGQLADPNMALTAKTVREEIQVKVSRIAVLAAALILGSGAAFAEGGPESTPQQWTIITTSETAPNATPVAPTASAPNPCPANQQNDKPKDSNPNCFNPLSVTTDWTVSNGQSGSQNLSVIQANTFSNSTCSADGSVQSITGTKFNFAGWYQTTVKISVVDAHGNTDTITFTGGWTQNQGQFTGNFKSTGTCMNGNQGTFTATLFPTINGAYRGSFESNGGSNTGNGKATLTLNTDSNFNVTGSMVAAKGSGLCFSNLTIASQLANTYAPSIATGDVLEAVATDNSGNVVIFTASGTDGNGQQLGTDSDGNQKLYLTYAGLAGACSGISGHDIPFTKVIPTAQPPKHRPVRPVRVGQLLY